MGRLFFIFSMGVLGAGSLFANESPWYGDLNHLFVKSGYAFSRWKEEGNQRHRAHHFDCRATLFVYPLDQWSHTCCLSWIKLDFRRVQFHSLACFQDYRLYDDLVGDPLSVSVGWGIHHNKVCDPSRLAFFSPTSFNGELYIKLGKEKSKETSWSSRFWTKMAVESGNRGSPWVKGTVAWEKKRGSHVWSLFSEGFYGWSSYRQVSGKYSQAIDVGVGYGIETTLHGTGRIEFRKRVYSRFFPRSSFCCAFSWVYPFPF